MMMKQGLLPWNPCPLFLSPPSILSLSSKFTSPRIAGSISATAESVNDKALTARERRQMRNERRESKPAYNWREEVEERLTKKPKKQFKKWSEELNLDNLALMGPQWWIVRVSRISIDYISERLARLLVRRFPEMEFKVYVPTVQTKTISKNGSISIKPKPLFPGCLFLRCVLNKEIHDTIRESEGIQGILGSKVGNTKRQINRPRPVSANDIEAIVRQAKEEQQKANEAFEALHGVEGTLEAASSDVVESAKPSKSKRRSKKVPEPLLGKGYNGLVLGSTVQVTSGSFAGFSGILKKLDAKDKMATVGFTLFGKETLADLNVDEIVAQTN